MTNSAPGYSSPFNKSLNLLDNNQEKVRQSKHQRLYAICATIIGIVVISWASISAYVYTLNQRQDKLEGTIDQKISELEQRQDVWNVVNQYDQTLKALRSTKHSQQDIPHTFWIQVEDIHQQTNVSSPEFEIKQGKIEAKFVAENQDDEHLFMDLIDVKYNQSLWNKVMYDQAGLTSDVYENVVSAEFIEQ